jgi:hypothetical protein
MRLPIMVLALLSCGTCAEAGEAWTCSYPSQGVVGLSRLELAPPDLIDKDTQEHYRILENNAHGLVATQSVSRERPEWNWQWKPGDGPAVGAASVVINKETGEFRWGWMFTGGGRVPNEMTHGRCRKDYSSVGVEHSRPQR